MLRYLLLLCALLTVTGTSWAVGQNVIYKWTNDAGEIHYTQFPPANRKYEVMKQTTAPADDPDKIRSNLKEQVDAMDKAQEERAEAKNEAQEQDRIQARRKKNCEISKKNLANLHQGGNKAFMTSDGEVIRLTDDERRQRIEQANKEIEANCK